MKTLLFTFGFTLLGINLNFLPKIPVLILSIAIAMVLDLVTGMVRAKLENVLRSSIMLRETVKKFIQYFIAIFIAIGLRFLLKDMDADSVLYVEYIIKGLCIFIILIEIFSCCENIFAVDKTSPFSKYFITPLLKIMSFGFKNNPLVKAQKEMEEKQEH